MIGTVKYTLVILIEQILRCRIFQIGSSCINYYIYLGASEIPENPSSRIVFLFLLLLSVFLVTSYSAIIVSLLQTTSSAINSIPELMNGQFKLSMRNITYSITYVNVSMLVNHLLEIILYVFLVSVYSASCS
jgi:hypothetical protein